MAERGIPVPDGRTVTRDEGFASWLAMNEYLVEDDFLVNDVDGMPADPFSAEGLAVAEAAALQHFADRAAVTAPDNRELFDKYIRFIGEAFVRGLGFTWTNKPKAFDDGRAYLAVENATLDAQLEVGKMLTAAMSRRTGEEWAFVYRNMQEDLAAAR
jgi:hypothetical protein